MNQDYLQNTRFRLQSRVSKLKKQDYKFFYDNAKYFWVFIENNLILKSVFDDLAAKFPNYKEDASKIIPSMASTGGFEAASSEEEFAAWCLHFFEECKNFDGKTDIAQFLGQKYSGGSSKFQYHYEAFSEHFIEPLFDYVDEALDDQRVLLGVLQKFKFRVENFCRNELLEGYKSNTSKGEKILAYELYKYLHDQGVEFFLETESVSGDLDLLVRQKDAPVKILADAKIFKGDNKSYIVKGYSQLHQYLCDYNESIGYLVIFNISDKKLVFDLDGVISDMPYAQTNGKTIFFLQIDIANHLDSEGKKKSASKRGVMTSVLINRDDLEKSD